MKINFFQLNWYIICIFIAFSSCTTPQERERKKILEANQVHERIHRHHYEEFASYDLPRHRLRPSYPWEERLIGEMVKISKEHFRCRGHQTHPIKRTTNSRGETICLVDCGGIDRHSLPVREGKEFIYPALIELLGYVQERLKRPVIVTCGHRCPAHNQYADDSKRARTSKHLVGAEVDFYVEGYEESPESVIELLVQYYRENGEMGPLATHRGLSSLARVPLSNREVVVRLYGKTEGRDFDNEHPYPYISIELLYDKEAKKRVHYTWHGSFNGYMRY